MKKKKLRLKKKPIIILLITLSLLFFIISKNLNSSNNKEEQKVESNKSILIDKGYTKETVKLIEEKLNDEEITQLEESDKIENLNLFINEKYYLHKNLDRYIAYYATHKESLISEVIAIVNVNADRNGYENPIKADLSKGILVLVNKYNKLEENYEPQNMLDISLKYAYEGRKIIPEVNEAFINMYNDAKKDGISLFVTSAYRSYTYQNTLYSNYTVMYGQEYADTVSAKPGFSEHQTALALDILTPGVQMSDFENTEAYIWLKDNSYKYGFILRYPENKTHLTGYAFESWHYRYIGIDYAQKVFNEGITYDEYYAYYLDN